MCSILDTNMVRSATGLGKMMSLSRVSINTLEKSVMRPNVCNTISIVYRPNKDIYGSLKVTIGNMYINPTKKLTMNVIVEVNLVLRFLLCDRPIPNGLRSSIFSFTESIAFSCSVSAPKARHKPPGNISRYNNILFKAGCFSY